MRVFNEIDAVNEAVRYIRAKVKNAGCSRVVLGISGGKDSTVVAMLAVKALRKDNVFGIMMPNGVQHDVFDALKVCKTLGIHYMIDDIDEQYKLFEESGDDFFDYACECCGELTKNPEAMINVSPRIRMTSLYNKAAYINALVIGTGNQCERIIGYFTKYGDGGCDFNPIGLFTVSEVVAMGKLLAKEFGIEEELIVKTPSDGLSGMSDEEKLGISYEKIEAYLRGNRYLLNDNEYNKILAMHKKSEHKRHMPDMYDYYDIGDDISKFDCKDM